MNETTVINLIVDLIILLIIGGGLAYGSIFGIIKVVEKPLKWLSSFVLATLAAVSLSSKLVLPLIEGPLMDKAADYIAERCTGEGGIPIFYRLMGVTEEKLASGADAVAADLVAPAATMLSVILTFFVVLIFGKLLLGLGFGCLNLIFKIDGLKTVSRYLGAVVGLLLGFVLALLLSSLFGFCNSILLFEDVGFLNEFTGGPVFKLMSNIWSALF